MKTLYILFCCSLAFSFCLAQTDAEIEKYIQQLGHEDYTVREYAEQQILRAGARSVPFLKKALDSGDAEVSWRAETLLEEIQQKLKDPQKKTPLPKVEIDEPEIFVEEPTRSEPIEEESEIEPLLEEQNAPKARRFFTSSISIIQNGKLFQVNGRSDGSFQVRTEEVLPNGQKETKEMVYESEADFQSGNPDLFRKYKKASEGFSFERVTPRAKKQPQSSFGFSFGSPDSQFSTEDFSDIADILQELLGNQGDIDFNRLLQKGSTQRLLEKALDSFGSDPQFKQMFEMQKEMMRQFSSGGGFQEDDLLEMQKEMMRQFGFDLDPDLFGSSAPKKKSVPSKKKASVEKKEDALPPQKGFEETMEAFSFKGLELAPMTEALKNHLPHRGVVVAKAEGRAQEIGFLPYDLILSINDVSTTTPEEAVKVLSRLQAGSTVKIRLIRKMKEVTLSFSY